MLAKEEFVMTTAIRNVLFLQPASFVSSSAALNNPIHCDPGGAAESPLRKMDMTQRSGGVTISWVPQRCRTSETSDHEGGEISKIVRIGKRAIFYLKDIW